MRRLLSLTLAALLASLMSTSFATADGLDKDEPGDRRVRHAQWRKHKPPRHQPEEPAKIPIMFQEISPHRAKKIQGMASRHPEEHRRIVRRLHRMAREMEELQLFNMEEFERRIEMMKMEDQVDELADRLREAKNDKEQNNIKQELGKKLAELFDHKEAAQRARIARMEKEIKELKVKLDRRHRMRSKIIEKRLNELKGDEDLEF